MERNRILGNTEQLCKSSLQCLNSTSCTVKITRRAKCPKGVLEHPIVCVSLDRAHWSLHVGICITGTRITGTWGLVLVLQPELSLLELPPSCLRISTYFKSPVESVDRIYCKFRYLQIHVAYLEGFQQSQVIQKKPPKPRSWGAQLN